ncbi:MAG: hypothetical protein P8179_19050 [Candidatus Thiodiazotropha sp.]
MCACGGAGQGCIHARRAIARYSKELQRRHVPPQACQSCWSFGPVLLLRKG